MAQELLVNNGYTTLNGSLTAAATSVVVADATTFPSITGTTGQFRIQVGKLNAELMLVTAVSGSTFTVTRGVEGTTARAHNDKEPVVQLTTARGVYDSTGGTRTVTAATDTIASTDARGTIIYNRATAVAVTLPQAVATDTDAFGAHFWVQIINIGAGLVTVTPTTSTINGATTQTFQTNAGGVIVSDGTNYEVMAGGTSPLTTKGDVYTFTTVNARLPVGADGRVLQADSAQTTGLGYSTRAFDFNSQNLTGGTWQGTVIAIAYGGTNSGTALTNNQIMVSSAGKIVELGAMTNGQIIVGVSAGAPSVVSVSGDGTLSSTGVLTVTSVADVTSGILAVANGGTNSSTALTNKQIMVSSAGKIVEAGAMTNGQLLIGSTGAAPVVAALTGHAPILITNNAGGITFDLGIVAVGTGGTGAASFTADGVLYGNGTSALGVTAAGTTNTLLHGNTGAAPTFSAVVEADLSLSDNTTANVSTTAHGFIVKLPNDATKFFDGTGVWDTVSDADLSLTDVTTNNVSTTKHGFAPKAPNDATKFLDGTGAYSAPAGSGGPGPFNCRVYTTTAKPEQVDDAKALTTLYCGPYQGNSFWIWNGTVWKFYNLVELSIPLAPTSSGATHASTTIDGLTASVVAQLAVGMQVTDTGGNVPANTTISTIASSTSITVNNTCTANAADTLTFKVPENSMYDLFVAFDGTNPALRMLVWTSTTGRATNLHYKSGVQTNSANILTGWTNGSATITTDEATYVGSFCSSIATAGQTDDSISGFSQGTSNFGDRLVWSYFNRIEKTIRIYDTATSWSIAVGDANKWNVANKANKAGSQWESCAFVIGVKEDVIHVITKNYFGPGAATNAGGGISIASTANPAATTPVAASQMWGAESATSGNDTMGHYISLADYGIGLNYAQWIENAGAADTSYGSFTQLQSGVLVTFLG